MRHKICELSPYRVKCVAVLAKVQGMMYSALIIRVRYAQKDCMRAYERKTMKRRQQ